MLLLLLLATARAEPPPPQRSAAPATSASPARLCADAASGSEIEVCLRLAASHPEAVDGIAAALRARLDRATTADRELMLALLALLGDERGVQATERLAELGDPRALQPLVHAAETRAAPVALAAVAALPTWPESIRPLSDWLVDADAPITVRLAAADALATLATLGTDEAGDALVDLLRRPGVPAPLRDRAVAALQRTWPRRVARVEGQPSADGTAWIAVGSAWALGTTMATAGHLGEAQLGALGAATGIAAGSTAGYLFGRAWPMEAGNAAFVTTSSMLGTAGGALVGAGASDDPDLAWWLGLGGTAAGYGLGYGLRGLHPGTELDAVEGAGVALLGGTAAGALAALDHPWDDDAVSLAAGIGILGGGLVGHAVAPAVDLEARDTPLLLAATGYGTAIGGLLAPSEVTAPLAGGTLGALAGYGLAAVAEAPPDVLLGGAVGAGLGGALGAGIGQLAGDPRAPTLVGGLAGLAGGTLLAAADPEPVDDRDVILVSLATGWTAWQVGGWTVAAHGDLRGPSGGLALAAPAAVGIGTALVANEVDLPATHAVSAASIGLWGGWFGGMASEVADAPPLPGALIGSNLGLVGGAAVLSPAVGLAPLVVGFADAGGVLGGSTAALLSSLGTAEPDAIRLAALVGSGVGLVAGASIGAAWRGSGNTRDIALGRPTRLPGLRVAVAPALVPAGYGARLQVTGW